MELLKTMDPILTEKIENGDEWIHQIKWDGVRGITYINDGEQKTFTKRGRERTNFYPEIHHLHKKLKAKKAIIDGELIVLDENGKPAFERVLVRERVSSLNKVNYYARNYSVKYIVFDLLQLDNQNLTKETLKRRLNLLREIIVEDETIALTTDFPDGKKLFNLMKEKGWEGIISKRISSPYSPGKDHDDWYKIKIKRKILAVVGGVQWRDDNPNALLLGLYQEGSLLEYIGKASIGLKQKDFLLIKEHIQALKQQTLSFQSKPLEVKDKDITWTKPLLTLWVEFLEWTNDGHLRHPKILGFSSKKAFEATGEEVVNGSNDKH